MNKQTLREQMKWICAAIDPKHKQRQSKEICETLLLHPKVSSANTIWVYENFADEVALDLLIQEFVWTKKILIPHSDHEYAFVDKYSKQKYFAEIDLIIVPGRAFTAEWARLWRWGGWYDRVLKNFEGAYLLGVCFAQQLLDDIPQDTHDMMMDEVFCWTNPSYPYQ